MIWYVYYNCFSRQQKTKATKKMAFPYDEANTVYGLTMERKKTKKIGKLKDKSNFREKHNEYNGKSTMKCAKFLCFYCYRIRFFFFSISKWRICMEFCWFQHILMQLKTTKCLGIFDMNNSRETNYYLKKEK